MNRLLMLCMSAGLLLMVSTPLYAHINGDHQLGLIDGLLHLLTEPVHVALLLPAVIVSLLLILRRVARKTKN